jgi:hypothetical protein
MKIYSIDKYIVIDAERLIIINKEINKNVTFEIGKILKIAVAKKTNSINVTTVPMFKKIMKYLANEQHNIIKVL